MIFNQGQEPLEEHLSTRDSRFLGPVRSWLETKPEILVLIRYSGAAGSKSFESFSSFVAIADKLAHLPPSTSVTAFKQPQLPMRGVVDDRFIADCLSTIADGTEFLVLETVPRTAGKASWFHDEAGESHQELREALEDSRGCQVAVGPYPASWNENSDVISAIVPDEQGNVLPGIY